jgi:hypothetical protein
MWNIKMHPIEPYVSYADGSFRVFHSRMSPDYFSTKAECDAERIKRHPPETISPNMIIYCTQTYNIATPVQSISEDDILKGIEHPTRNK